MLSQETYRNSSAAGTLSANCKLRSVTPNRKYVLSSPHLWVAYEPRVSKFRNCTDSAIIELHFPR